MADSFPVSPGHTLIVPARHIQTLFDATDEEQRALLFGLRQARELVEATRKPDGYNIGINQGDAGGQTVAHLHLHLIPRYRGDRADPRGGIRWVLPDRAKYWE
jgi:diadenosine tetraphosphate (Ap4A) HIT family hydrolase